MEYVMLLNSFPQMFSEEFNYTESCFNCPTIICWYANWKLSRSYFFQTMETQIMSRLLYFKTKMQASSYPFIRLLKKIDNVMVT